MLICGLLAYSDNSTAHHGSLPDSRLRAKLTARQQTDVSESVTRCTLVGVFSNFIVQ